MAPLIVGRAYDQDSLPRLVGGDVFCGDGRVAPGGLTKLLNSTEAFQNRDRLADLSLGRVSDRLAEVGVALTANGVEPGDAHPGLLHLMDRSSGFNRVMLALIADEDDPRNACIPSHIGSALTCRVPSRLDSSTIESSLLLLLGRVFSSKPATVRDRTPPRQGLDLPLVGAKPWTK